jgi:Uma2 family endonuclease
MAVALRLDAVAEHATKITEKPITDEDLMRLPRDGRKWELVDGRLQEVATSFKHDQIVIWLGRLMGPYADDIGGLTASQAGFRMSNHNVRSPDFGFTRYDRFPNGEVPDGFAEFAPDLAVEIISPSEEPGDMTRKVDEYFASGAQQVWHMFPETLAVKVFRSPSDVTMLGPDDEVDLDDLLPGFRSRVADLFRKR